eukprot:6040300-Pleurochrysis_carterae.AAC.1
MHVRRSKAHFTHPAVTKFPARQRNRRNAHCLLGSGLARSIVDASGFELALGGLPDIDQSAGACYVLLQSFLLSQEYSEKGSHRNYSCVGGCWLGQILDVKYKLNT